ncbi:putative ATP dependent RNA helicase [Ceraceosorus guamensis]|uniref:RNA helicase n=1 Tax=Ceraceosorus guamensis TaxID=1522189 RepID=A0A316W8J9_9BASI|nr:putative ATP dependent RNA helicase [Ceraceosorus guamensis]PWN44015.1 putative ATP dependent RNA helicase [Ceraceosorus guamensis]
MPPKKPDLSGYQYSAISSLVTQTDRRLVDRHDNEPSGAPESLIGRISHKDMGARVVREQAKDVEKKKRKAMDEGEIRLNKKGNANGGAGASNAGGLGGSYADVLQATADIEGLTYVPRTAETRQTYEMILNIVLRALGDQTSDVVRSATDGVIETLKLDDMRDHEKAKEVESILGTDMSQESFGQLVNLSKKLTDYSAEGEDVRDPDADKRNVLDEDGVAVLFEGEDEDEEEEGETYVVREESDDEDDAPAAANGDEDDDAADEADSTSDAEAEGDAKVTIGGDGGQGASTSTSSKSKSGPASRTSDTLTPFDVDAFWLQRLVAASYPDEHESSSKASKALEILAQDTPARDAENDLMELFDYEHFDIVQTLIKNRELVVWCTRLGRADESSRADVEVSMREAGVGWILKALRGAGDARAGAKGSAAAGLKPLDIDEDAKARARKITTAAALAPGSTLAPRKGVDLEAMAFTAGGHLNTNAKVRLPEGSFKRSKKGYEEIHVPAPVKKDVPASERIQMSSLPAWAQTAFPGAKDLNAVQSKCYPIAFGSDEPMLLCAPTGAGKTNVAMLTILNELGKWRDEETGTFDLTAFKIVYVAPMKALVAEQTENFRARLSHFGVQVNELTGDSQLTKQQIADTQIIVTTPEKWDVVSRKSTDSSYTNLVRLMIVDEIHLLHDDRGPVLEAIIARTIRRMEQLNDPVRLVGLSATLPNYKDVATFLRVNTKRGLFYFEASYRPCPLQQEYVGITEKKAIKRFQIMNDVCYEKTLDQAGKNQVMIFVHSRKETAKTAKFIRDMAMEQDTLARFLPQSSASREVLQTEIENVKDANLRDVMPYGFGIHHAGMGRADRQLVEDLFGDGHLQVLVSTATLAWGVNLPAHTVIIKGTQIYNPEKGRWAELSPQDMLQMLGRAGRPQYDTFGEGIIITNHDQLQYYLSLLNQQLPIESQLVSRLADNLNAEIVLGTIRNRDEAVAWLGYTYLYVRMLRSPALYSVTADYAEDDPFLEQKRADIIHSAAVWLEKSGMLRYDRRTGQFATNDLGRVGSHFYVSHTSMSTYLQHLKPHMGLIELFRVFSLSDEFKHQMVRQDEKLEVGKLLERVPIPVKETLEDPAAKINVLLQTWISQLKLEGYVLAADMVYVTQSAGRILRALFEICLKRGYARLSHVALDLSKMAESRQWNSMTPLRQFKGVPPALVRRLERMEYPFHRLRDLEPNEIGELIGEPKAGRLVHRLVHQFPKLELQAFFQPVTRSLLHVQLTITPDFQWEEKHHGHAQLFHILVEDVDGEIILFHDTFQLRQRYAEEEHQVSFTVPVTDPVPPNYFISVVSDKWLQSEVRLPISFKNLILPEKFPPHTRLEDRQPMPVSGLQSKDAQALFQNQFGTFNKVQTQTYHTIYETNDSAFVGAPTGAGKTVIAELAMLRLWNNSSAKGESQTPRTVCLVPFLEMLAPRVAEWKAKFGAYRGGREVVGLTGETSADLRLLEMADVIVATPDQWDVLSRRWRQRKNVQSIGLYVADEVHMLGDWRLAATYEVVLSRARFVAAQTGNATRFVALSVPLGNAKDVGDWLGAPSSAVYNFSPAARPVPVEVHIQSFSIPHFPSLMIAMVKPAYLSIIEHAAESPVLAFVPSRKQTKLTANDLLAYVLSDSERENGESRFLNIEMNDLKPHLQRLQDRELAELLEHGIGYYHESLSRGDKAIVERLYNAGAIQVVIASRETAWSIPLTAHMVLILSVQTYEGKEHRYVDYPLTDVLQMVGKATRRGPEGQSSRVILLLQATRKAFFMKFLAEGLPIESRLGSYAQDFFNAEIVARTIDDKQSAVDILTWTLMYRRLQQNPQAYNCQGSSMQHIGDFLSELVETSLADLENSKCIAIEDEMDVAPLNLGMISSFYNISYVTIDVFNMSLKERTKLKGLLEIVSSSAEFEDLPIRQHEDVVLRRVYDRLPHKLDRINLQTPYHKVFVLLQAHFARLSLPADLENDQRLILTKILNLLSACVDVMSSNAFLNALVAMELSQMCVQAVWDRDSPLRQVPHFTADTIARCKARGIEDVFALGDTLPDLSDKERDDLLRLDKRQLADVAKFTNNFPYIEVSFNIEDQDALASGTPITMNVNLAKDDDEEEEDEASDPTVVAPFYPNKKLCNWWLIVGDPGARTLLSIKRVTITKSLNAKLEFTLPKGTHSRLRLYLMSDSYIGADREVELPNLEVAEGEDSDEDEEDEDEEDEEEEEEESGAAGGAGDEDVEMADA